MFKLPAAKRLFRVQGKTISVVSEGRATVVTLTFDAMGASGCGAELDATSAIAMPCQTTICGASGTARLALAQCERHGSSDQVR